MLILPSRGRPDQLKRFFVESLPEVPGVVLLDEDDFEKYENVPMPPNWTVHVGKRVFVVPKYNRGFGLYPHEDWYGWIGDDFVCKTPRWDTQLRDEALAGYIAWGDDTINHDKNSCAPFIPGAIVRKAGWLAWPGTHHLYCDEIWWQIAHALGIARYRSDIVTKAYHWSVGNQEFDKTAEERGQGGDDIRYDEFKKSGEYERLIGKLRTCLPLKLHEPSGTIREEVRA